VGKDLKRLSSVLLLLLLLAWATRQRVGMDLTFPNTSVHSKEKHLEQLYVGMVQKNCQADCRSGVSSNRATVHVHRMIIAASSSVTPIWDLATATTFVLSTLY